jgi:hypothetical protein
MPRTNQAGLTAALAALIACVVLWPAGAAPQSLRAQADTTVVEVASGPLGEPTLGLVGRNEYSGDTITLYGYVSAVADLNQADLFTGAPSVATARFTYAGDVAVASSTRRADTTSRDGTGTVRIYLHPDGGANWSDVTTFSAGQEVAEYAFDLRETLQRQAQGSGVAVGDGKLTQNTANEFELGADRFRFGVSNIEQRLRYVGVLMPGAQGTQSLTVNLTGSVKVTRREAVIAPVGGPASVGTPTAVSDECVALQPWLTQTRGTLAQARTLGAVVPAGAAMSALDADAARQAAAAVAALADRQRGVNIPAGAADANRLAVTALSTYARGLQAVADAVAAQDAELFGLGQIALQDGVNLLGRADQAVNELGMACEASGASGS